MTRKTLVIAALMLALMAGNAQAFSGEIILEDTLYGGAIGGLLGGAWWLLDQDEPAKKLGTGVGIGLFGGFVLGVTDVSAMAEIEDGVLTVGIPRVITELKVDKAVGHYELVYRTDLLSVKF